MLNKKQKRLIEKRESGGMGGRGSDRGRSRPVFAEHAGWKDEALSRTRSRS